MGKTELEAEDDELRDILRIQWVWKTVKKAEKGRERDRRKKEKRNGLIDWFMIKTV